MLVPRSPEAIFAFFEAQDGLGEHPDGSNDNWITRACRIIDAWCVMTKSMAYLAAGFNTEGRVLDFGSPVNPPDWAVPGAMPQIDGLGYRQRYRWGCAYTWDESDFAAETGQWTTELDAFVPGCTVLVNHNGRGNARTSNSHTAVGIERSGGRTLTWNGNISNRIRTAYWSDAEVEGFAIPTFVTASPTPPAPTFPMEDTMAFRFTHKGTTYVSDGIHRRRVQSPGIDNAMARARVRPDGDGTKRPDGTVGVEVWPPLWLDGGQEVQDDVFNQLVDLDR